jgi:hypothetical protein
VLLPPFRAALVGLLISVFPHEHPREALSIIATPFIVAGLLFLSGALIFALIAASAVFASDSNDIIAPVVVGASCGASLFGYAYLGSVFLDAHPEGGGSRFIETWRWLQKPRPKREQGGHPDVSGEAVAPTADNRLGQAASKEGEAGSPPAGAE